ncbi:MAG: hypothetical protein ABSB96_05125 [Gaiellaceae bacterium]
MSKRQNRQKKKARQQSRRRGVDPEMRARELVDKRGISTEVTAIGGVPVVEPHTVVVIEPIRLADGSDLYFQSPFVEVFYLLKAKALRDAAEPKRMAALNGRKQERDGTFRPLKPADSFDALEDLALAVILAAAAIETHVNNMIARLPEDSMVEIPLRRAGKTIVVMRDKAAMDRLPIGDKLARAVPLLHSADSIKGTVAWQKYRKIFKIRNALMHPKREAINDPLKPSPFGRLMLGEGSVAPEDAASVIEAVEPGWLPHHVREELGL